MSSSVNSKTGNKLLFAGQFRRQRGALHGELRLALAEHREQTVKQGFVAAQDRNPQQAGLRVGNGERRKEYPGVGQLARYAIGMLPKLFNVTPMRGGQRALGATHPNPRRVRSVASIARLDHCGHLGWRRGRGACVRHDGLPTSGLRRSWHNNTSPVRFIPTQTISDNIRTEPVKSVLSGLRPEPVPSSTMSQILAHHPASPDTRELRTSATRSAHIMANLQL